MAATVVTTFADLIEKSADSNNSPITLGADIDAREEDYLEPVTVGTGCNLDLNGHTLSNAFFANTGFFASGRSVTNGTLLNVYIDGEFRCYAERVTASMYVTGGVGLNLKRSAVDITCSPANQKTQLANSTTTTCILSNVVVRNATFVGTTGGQLRLGTTHNFGGIVLDGCTFTAGTSSDIIASFGGKHCYWACVNCTVDSSVTSFTMANASYPLALVCAPLTADPTGIQRVSEADLRSSSYLESIGFLP